MWAWAVGWVLINQWYYRRGEDFLVNETLKKYFYKKCDGNAEMTISASGDADPHFPWPISHGKWEWGLHVSRNLYFAISSNIVRACLSLEDIAKMDERPQWPPFHAQTQKLSDDNKAIPCWYILVYPRGNHCQVFPDTLMISQSPMGQIGWKFRRSTSNCMAQKEHW